MYIRTTKNQRGDAYYHLVEAYRQDGKVKQRTLMSLGRTVEVRISKALHLLRDHLKDYLT